MADAEDNFQYHYYPKYDSPKKRKYDYIPYHEGMNSMGTCEYANVDIPNHYFKEELAIPWLNTLFSNR